MMPTAISQIIEALCKLFLGLGLAMVIMSLTLWPEDIRNRLAASGALIGVSFGSVLSVIYLAFNHFRTRRGSAAGPPTSPTGAGWYWPGCSSWPFPSPSVPVPCPW
ncbi:hypothetical protein M5E87_09875 [Flavonifractor plautii]|nr:hypothetical protein M5E87_09875 [Flavonifractor plautii]